MFLQSAEPQDIELLCGDRNEEQGLFMIQGDYLEVNMQTVG